MPTDLAIHADAKDFLEKCMLEDLPHLHIDEWRTQIAEWKQQHPFQEKTQGFSTKNALQVLNQEMA